MTYGNVPAAAAYGAPKRQITRQRRDAEIRVPRGATLKFAPGAARCLRFAPGGGARKKINIAAKNYQYRDNEKIDIAVIKKISIATMKKLISRRQKNQYRDDEKIDIAAIKKSISRRRKN
jgi:hypothetical protein